MPNIQHAHGARRSDMHERERSHAAVPTPNRQGRVNLKGGPHDASQYATCDTDAQTKPVYKPTDDRLPLRRDLRQASLNLMILTYAARRHAQWLNKIGVCPPDVAQLILADLDAVAQIIRKGGGAAPSEPAVSPRGPDVAPRSQDPAPGDGGTPDLFAAHSPTSAKYQIGTTPYCKRRYSRREQSPV